MMAPTVEQLVDILARDFKPCPWTGRVPSIETIIAVVRRSYGDRAARRAEKMITVH